MDKYETGLLDTFGRPVLKNPGCKKCYGRGWESRLIDTEFKKLQALLESFKLKGEITSLFEIGPYIQCPHCIKWLNAHGIEILEEKKEKEVEEKKDGM